jgi:hypothetical protein
MTEKTNVPALGADFIAKLMGGIAESRATTVIAGGKPFFRLSRAGIFIYGQNNEEVQEGSRWAVNIMSMSHGWSCWVDGGPGQANSLAGEVMTPMSVSKPPLPEPIDGTPFKEQRSFEMKCMNGEDKGVEVIYKINSVGGMRAIDGLLAAIYDQLAANPAYPCPVLTFSSESYPHKKWGEIFVPIFNIVGWCDLNGTMQGAKVVSITTGQTVQPPPAEPLKAEPPKPARRRKPPVVEAAPPADLTVAAPPVAPQAPVQPVPTAQTHVGQRRRPAAS